MRERKRIQTCVFMTCIYNGNLSMQIRVCMSWYIFFIQKKQNKQTYKEKKGGKMGERMYK